MKQLLCCLAFILCSFSVTAQGIWDVIGFYNEEGQVEKPKQIIPFI